MTNIKKIYLFRVTATATKNNKQAASGKQCTILVFVYGTTIESAEVEVHREVKGHGWSNVTIEEKADFNTSTLDDAKTGVIQAYNNAVKDGIAMLIFPD